LFVNRLIEDCPPLDQNSAYCNFLQCGHFAETSAAAIFENHLTGFVSGYIQPDRPDTLFIWQVAVHKKSRGVGLSTSMLLDIVSRNSKKISFIETTITRDNEASWNTFRSLARLLSANLAAEKWIDRESHFKGMHDSEYLVRIGPYKYNKKQIEEKIMEKYEKK